MISKKYTILKYVCVISLELILTACVYDHVREVYINSDKERYAIEKQLNKSEEDNVVVDDEPLKKAFQNRIQKDEVAKKAPGKYRCKFTSEYQYKKNPVFSKYYIYNKKTNKKVGEGYIAPTCEVIGDFEKSMEGDFNYITYIKVYNPDDSNESYIVKEPGSVIDFEFEKMEESK